MTKEGSTKIVNFMTPASGVIVLGTVFRERDAKKYKSIKAIAYITFKIL